MKNDKMKDFRNEIDNINNKILNLLGKRIEITKKVGKYKKERGLKILDKKREAKVFSDLRKKAEKRGLDKNYINSIFKLIIKNSRKIQK